MSEKRLFPLKSQVVRGGGGFSVTLGESFQHRQLQFPLLQLFQLQCSEILWLCGHSVLSCLIQKICLYDKEKASLSSLFFFSALDLMMKEGPAEVNHQRPAWASPPQPPWLLLSHWPRLRAHLEDSGLTCLQGHLDVLV